MKSAIVNNKEGSIFTHEVTSSEIHFSLNWTQSGCKPTVKLPLSTYVHKYLWVILSN